MDGIRIRPCSIRGSLLVARAPEAHTLESSAPAGRAGSLWRRRYLEHVDCRGRCGFTGGPRDEQHASSKDEREEECDGSTTEVHVISLGRARCCQRSLEPLLFEVVLELAAARGVAQLAQRLGLDLTDALARHVELLAHLLEGPGAPVLEPEAQLQHAPLAP